MAASLVSSTSNSTQASPSPTHHWNHDVFLSYRRIDTGKKFVSHLYAALRQRGILIYVYSETLQQGVPMRDELIKARYASRIAIVVLSENFGNSSSCLTELAHIMDCRDKIGQIIIPIFYHVNPSDVRKQTGKFHLFEERGDIAIVRSLRNALTNIGNLPGWEILVVSELVCIREVVDTIWNKLYPNEIRTGLQQDLMLRSADSLDHSEQINTSMTSSKVASHDVFLNFYGKDTRYKFVDHLHSAFDQHGILTYVDTETSFLDRSHSLLKIIEDSKISIIIFSQEYASSSWCVDQLAYIMKCRDERGLIVIPIFYDIDVAEVRRQEGSFRKAFSEYEVDHPHKVELWRETIKHACNLSGWHTRYIADGNEAKGIQLIVKKIEKILFPDKGHIGLQTRLHDMEYRGGGVNTIPSSSHKSLENLRIPLHKILQATNNFSRQNIIASGGFGKVYRGLSEQHGLIAIKHLVRSNRSGQGDDQFIMEIALLSAYKHENLVSLVGYCDQDEEKILVLKYETNGSLDNHLRRKELTWIQRLQICLDDANGLKYLHEDVGRQHRILHRDIKSSNILLDENLKAKISDFGLSKLTLSNVPGSIVMSQACGTIGYIDPQYQAHNHLSQKSDVYSFGVVLFEVLCSRLANVRNYQDECEFSATLAQSHYENKTLDDIIDSVLRSEMDSHCLSTYSAIAYQCLKAGREERPTMGMVVDQLEKALDYQQGSSGSWHDVYFCFRQRDTECHIVNDIFAALQLKGVSTYKEDMTLSRKESKILKAIKRSRLFIIVFTAKFAVNPWYLDEVVKIVESMKERRQFVLPVFLNVTRFDVRNQEGYFGEVMSEYDTHPRMEAWGDALVEVTNVSGLEYSKFRSSADLVKKVVEDVVSSLSVEV